MPGVSYFSINAGIQVMAIQYSVGSSNKINSVTFKAGQVHNGHQYPGDSRVRTGTRRTIRGAIWTSRPSINGSPNFRSTNSINVSSCYQLPKNAAGNIKDLTNCTFTFDNAIVSANSTIYIGLTGSPNSSAFCFGRENGKTLYWSHWNGYLSEWSNNGLAIQGIDVSSPVTAPGAPRNVTISPRLIESGNYTVSWNAPSSGDTPTGYKCYFNGSSSVTNTVKNATSLSTSKLTGVNRGTNFSWKVVAYNSAGDGGSGSATARRNAVPTAPTKLTVAGGASVISKGSTFNVTATGATAPAADAKSPYNDSVAKYQIQYRFSAYGGSFGDWKNLRNANGVEAYEFNANSSGNLDRNLPVPSDVPYGGRFRVRVYAVDSLGAKSSSAATLTTDIYTYWNNIWVRNSANTAWNKYDAFVKISGVWKRATVRYRSGNSWITPRST